MTLGRLQRPLIGIVLVFAIASLVAMHGRAAMPLPTPSPTPTPVIQTSGDLMTITVEGVSKAGSAVEAAREIQSTVITDTARAHVTEIIGEKRYQKSKSIIENKIIKQSGKFIPFVNASQPIATPDGNWKMSVELKLSISSLRKMIMDNGFMNEANGPSSLLPMVSFIDRRTGVALRWWQGEPKDETLKFVQQISYQFHQRLQVEFSRQGFHVIKPLGLQVSPLPESFRADRLSGSDLVFVSDYYGAPMILRGDVRFREAKDSAGRLMSVAQIAIKIEVLQANSGRVVAEVSRQFDADNGAYETAIRAKITNEVGDIVKDLATQVFEAWQRGTLSSNLMRLAIRGQLTPKQLGELKAGLMHGLRELKNLKERSFEAGQVVFEVDYSGDRKAFDEKLKGLQMAAFATKVSDSSDNGVVLEVKAH